MDVFDYWYATRTPNAAFEIPREDELSGYFVHAADSVQMDDAIRAAERHSRTLAGAAVNEALRTLDIIYCLAQEPQSARLQRRVATLSEYYAGQGKTNYQLAPSKGYDMVDIAGVDRHFMQYL
jgi:hypothetical protein